MADGAAPMGHNNPPDPFEAIRVHCEDLLIEARNWADGQPVESDEMAAEVDRLIADLRDAEKAAEEKRKEEVAPLDEQRDAIQARYNEYIAPLKNKKPGKLIVALAALKATVEPWRIKKAAEAAAAAEAARVEAQRIADEAAAAIRATEVSDLEGREAAEALVEAANLAMRDAARATNAATKGTGLTTYYKATLTDQKAAVLFYMREQPGEFLTLCQRLADADVRAGKRQIPGFAVTEEKRAA